MRLLPRVGLLLAFLASACHAPRGGSSSDEGERAAVVRVLDDFHAAASAADGPRYLGHLADDAIFLGTDAKERWTKAEFAAFCEPYFARDVGWTYTARARNVYVHVDVAWFDERLWNDKYGECRGTGVLRKEGGAWKIEQYNLTIPVPNELAGEIVKLIRGRPAD